MEKNMGLKMKEKMVKAKMTKINMEMSPQRNPIIMVKELEMMKIQTTMLLAVRIVTTMLMMTTPLRMVMVTMHNFRLSG